MPPVRCSSSDLSLAIQYYRVLKLSVIVGSDSGSAPSVSPRVTAELRDIRDRFNRLLDTSARALPMSSDGRDIRESSSTTAIQHLNYCTSPSHSSSSQDRPGVEGAPARRREPADKNPLDSFYDCSIVPEPNREYTTLFEKKAINTPPKSPVCPMGPMYTTYFPLLSQPEKRAEQEEEAKAETGMLFLARRVTGPGTIDLSTVTRPAWPDRDHAPTSTSPTSTTCWATGRRSPSSAFYPPAAPPPAAPAAAAGGTSVRLLNATSSTFREHVLFQLPMLRESRHERGQAPRPDRTAGQNLLEPVPPPRPVHQPPHPAPAHHALA